MANTFSSSLHPNERTTPKHVQRTCTLQRAWKHYNIVRPTILMNSFKVNELSNKLALINMKINSDGLTKVHFIAWTRHCANFLVVPNFLKSRDSTVWTWYMLCMYSYNTCWMQLNLKSTYSHSDVSLIKKRCIVYV